MRISDWIQTCALPISQRRALAYLSFGLSKGEGFVVITGEIGAGKTVFIDYFLDNLPKNGAVTATITSTQFEAESFLRMVASAFGLREEKADKATVFRMLEGFLLDVHRRNVRAILIIDEAQGIPAIGRASWRERGCQYV